MLNLVPINRVITYVAVTYAAIVVLISLGYLSMAEAPTIEGALRIALGGSLILNFVLLLTIYIWWKYLWKKFPFLGEALFPNLNGKWHMEIHWSGKEDSGVIEAVAVINQSLLKISMEVMSERSDSETMVALPKKDPESGRPLLFYVYRVVPKAIGQHSGPAYEGSAVLKFDGGKKGSLRGNYFTSSFTRGHFILRRE